MTRPYYGPHGGTDLSPLLPLGVFFLVVMFVFTPMAFQVVPVVRETAVQSLSLFWAVPLLIVAALFLTSSELLTPTYNYYDRRPRSSQYRNSSSQYGGEGPSWGLLGLMLLMLLLLPWRY